MIELLQLKYFLTVAKLEHITKAAEELRIAQPALTRTIRRLEEDLGVPLFDRRGRNIYLNPFGKAFQKKAQLVMHLLDEGRREVRDLAGLEKGRIFLAVLNLEQVQKPLQIFLEQYPDINFQMVQCSFEDFENPKDNHDIDFYLTSIPIQQSGFKEVPLTREQFYLAVPPTHRFANRQTIHLREVSDEQFVGFKENTPIRILNDKLCMQAGFQPKIVCETEDPESLAELVRTGFGIAIMGSCKGAKELNIVKIPIEHPTNEKMDLRIAWRKERYLSRAAITFRDFMIDYFKEENSLPEMGQEGEY